MLPYKKFSEKIFGASVTCTRRKVQKMSFREVKEETFTLFDDVHNVRKITTDYVPFTLFFVAQKSTS